MKTPVLVTALALVSTGVVAGQSARNGAFIGGGFEAFGVGAPYERAYGLSLQAGYVRQYRRLGLRLGVSYFERNRQLNSGYTARPRAVGFSGELSYDLTVTRFRPYVIAGWGLYRLSGTEVSTSGIRVVDQVSPAMIGGMGFRFRLRGMELFTEARVHGVTNGQGWGRAFMPVTFGVRFD